MMLDEQTIRILALVAAAAVLAYPFVVPAIQKAREWLALIPSAVSPLRQKVRDIETILGLSSRFEADGLKEGVALCQKLVELLLKPIK